MDVGVPQSTFLNTGVDVWATDRQGQCQCLSFLTGTCASLLPDRCRPRCASLTSLPGTGSGCNLFPVILGYGGLSGVAC